MRWSSGSVTDVLPTADIVILIVILVSAAIGLIRGLVKEVVSLTIWLSAFVLALAFAGAVADRVVSADVDPGFRVVAGFLIVFVAVLIVGALLQWLLSKIVKSTGLTGTDRFLGFLFGSVRGAIVVVVVLIAIRPFVETESWWAASRLRPELMKFEEDILHVLHYASDSIAEIEQDLSR